MADTPASALSEDADEGVREGGLRAVVAANSFAPLRPGSPESSGAEALARDAAERAFDIEHGPLFRAVLVKEGGDEHLLVLTLHHLVSDGWSFGVMAGELAALYGAFHEGRPSPLPPLPVQYPDFAAWQRAWLRGDVLGAQVGYWRRKLAGAPPRLELPTDLPRPAVQRHRGQLEQRVIEGDAAAGVLALARREGATLFMTLLAAWSLVLARWAGQNEVVVGTPIAGRTRGETEPLIGLFLNSLALRADLSGEPTFRELLRRVRETTLEAYAHQDVPFERVLEELQPERSMAHAPVFQVMLNLANFGGPGLALPGIDVEPVAGGAEVGSKLDLTLYAAEWDGGIVFSLVYDADLFGAERMREMLAQLAAVLRQAASAPERPVTSISLLTDEARAVLPDPTAPLSAEWRGSVPALFARHAAATPDALAVADPRETWTYAELEKASNRIARTLGEAGVGGGDVVAIWAHRSAGLVRALMGTLKAGAAFVILDPVYPPARLAAYVRTAAPRAFLRVAAAGAVPDEVADALDDTVRRAITLGEKAERDGLFGVPATAPQVEIGPDSLAYLAFTSGTTGQPKAVMGRHGSLTHFTAWIAETFGLTADDRHSLLSGLAHDPLHRDVFIPLQLGAAIIAPEPEEIGTPGYLAAWMRAAGITVANLTPAIGQLLGMAEATEQVPSLRRAFLVGDMLTRTEVARLHALAPALEVVNYYGSTETQRALGWFAVPRPASLLPRETVPAGVGIPDVQLLVRTPSGALAGIGEVGEIWMRSPHIALGYLGDPALTAERFIPNPFAASRGDADEAVREGGLPDVPAAGFNPPQPAGAPHSAVHTDAGVGVREGGLRAVVAANSFAPEPSSADPMYRTGDVGRYRPDGVVEIAGRADRQVKIRGFRIEPGEVEAALATHPAVREAAVLPRGDGDALRLVAWVVASDKKDNGVDAEALREHVADLLPEWMVPAAFVLIPALPLTPNGKLNAAALPDPEPAAAGHVPPRTETERALAAIWAELLDAEAIGATGHFFHLGGHSLMATRLSARVRAAFGVELPLRAVFEHPTLAALAANIDARRQPEPRDEPPARPGSLAPAHPAEAEKVYPVSFAQRRLWLLEQIEPGNTAYNIAGGLRLRGRLDVAALERALGEIVRRHETLRTRIETRGDEPVQVVSPPAHFHFPTIEAPGAGDDELARMLSDEGARAMDLARGPLFRATLVRGAADDHALLWTVHHAMSDGWSTGIILSELAALYQAFAAGRPSPLPPLPLQYGTHAERERERFAGDGLDREVRWWKETLAGAPALLEVPTDRPRPAVQSYRGSSFFFHLPAGTGTRVEALARGEGATAFMVLLGAFDAVLARWSGQTDLVVGTPIAGRATVEVEPLIGFFANTLALRADLGGDPTFRELLARTRDASFDAFEHQALPFERLVEELAPERSLGHAPVFQVMLAYQNMPRGQGGWPGVDVSIIPRELHAAKFDLSVSLALSGDGVEGLAEYATDLFNRGTVERFLGHFGTLLNAALAAPDARLSALPLLRADERAELLRLSAGPTAERDPSLTLHGLFEAQAARTPDAPAVTFDGASRTYAELDAAANRVAHLLRARGAGAETPVAVVMERSPEMVVALHGILKSGAFYVPIEPDHPAERIAWMLEDSGARIILTQQRWMEILPGWVDAVALDDPAALDGFASSPVAVDADPDALAYVIYTSGSTGRPKGAGNTHRAVANRVLWMQETFGLGADDVVLQKTPFGFDVSVWEFFWPLMAGARLAVAAPGAHREPARLSDAIRRERVTTLHFVPSMLQLWVDDASAAECATLRRVISSGEALPADLRDRFLAWLPRVELHNLYGPTEAAVDVTWHPCAPGDDEPAVPIGRPIANTRIHVLDAAGALAPVGVPGELFIAGVQVGRGYQHRPSLTAERFVPDPFSQAPGARMYRTGDRARWQLPATMPARESAKADFGPLLPRIHSPGRPPEAPEPALEYLGRLDFQVKLRGLRIEPGEIEAALAAEPAVRQAVAGVRPGPAGDPQLVAWVVAAEGRSIVEDSLRETMGRRLPRHMVPAVFVVMDALPLTPSGKVNRAALPDPGAREVSFIPPTTPVEEVLAGIWGEVLRRDQAVGAGDDFFALGGHSLLATLVVSRVRDRLGVELPLRAVFESPRLAAMAAAVEARMRDGAAPDAPPITYVEGNDLPLSFAQERMWFIDRLEPGGAAYNLTHVVRFAGALDVAAMERAMGEIIRRHEPLRTLIRARETDDAGRQDGDGRLVQHVLEPEPFHLPVIPLPDDGDAEDAARLRAEAFARTPFDLARGPVLRAELLRIAAADHVLLVATHHVAADGWSMGIFFRELAALYAESVEGRPAALPDLPVRYADYAAWQRAWLTGERLERQVGWWRERLAGAPAVLELPTDRPRPPVQSFRGARWPVSLSVDEAAAVHSLSRAEGATPFMVLLAAFQAVLARWSGQHDVVVGTPVAGRTRAETEGLIGLFVNTLALRGDLSGDPAFRALLARVREATLGAYVHQEVPFERLVEELRPERSLGHAPVFQAMFTFLNTPGGGTGFPGLEIRPFGVEDEVAKFDLTLALGPRPDGTIGGSLEYAADLFDATTAERIASHFRTLLMAALRAPATPISALPLIGGAERDQLLRLSAGPAVAVDASRTVADLLAAHAAATPEAVAVEIAGDVLTYAELDARANRLARLLRARGVGPETPVALFLERSLETVVAWAGVLKSGGFAVPVDPADPAERVAWILEDSGVRVALTQEPLIDHLPASIDRIALDAPGALDGFASSDLEMEIEPQSLAYVIYTSGSTGRPKAATATHEGLARYAAAMRQEHGFTSADRVLHRTPASFDPAVSEIWIALAAGATVVVAPPGAHADPAALAREAADRAVTVIDLVPSLLAAMLDEPAFARCDALRLIFCGGEALAPALARRTLDALPRAELVNAYGPAETTITATSARVAPDGAVTIGAPLPGVRAYVLDPRGEPCPAGVPGELCVGGALVGRGYRGRPALTAERFIPDPFANAPGARMYRTGDRARWRTAEAQASGSALEPMDAAPMPSRESAKADFGPLLPRIHSPTPTLALDFLGRLDFQVKIRGQRIEPGEVESALLADPSVRDAVVAARPGPTGDPRLVAWLVAAEGRELAVDAVRDALARRLPRHLVPAAFVVMDELPRGAGGKADRRALPDPDDAGAEFIPPRTPVEEVLAAIWAEVLRRDRVGASDDFFALGGHSLLATLVVSRIRDRLGVELPLRAVFESPGLAAMASAVEARMRAGAALDAPPIVHVEGNDLPLSFAQERMWFIARLDSGSAAYHMSAALRLWGALDVAALERALGEVVRRHEPLRTVFRNEQDRPVQHVLPWHAQPLPVTDFSEDDEALSRRASEFATHPFDLEHGPLFRAALLRVRGDGDAPPAPSPDLVSGDDADAAVREGGLPEVPAAGFNPPESTAAPHPVASADAVEGVREGGLRAVVAANSFAPPPATDEDQVTEDGDHVLLLAMHHAVSDGWSIGIILRELAALYAAFAGGRPSPLPDLPIRYADYAVWQRAWLTGDLLAGQVAWWRERLASAPALLQLPTDRPRPAVQSHRGALHRFSLGTATANAVEALARAEGATPFMVLLAAFQAVLARWAGQSDVVVGTPVAGRTRRQVEPLVGLFVNTLALRGDLSGDPAFRELLARVRETTLGAFAHQDVPFERLVEELHPERSLGHSPVFQVMFAFQNVPDGGGEGFPGLRVGGIPHEAATAHFDLALALAPAADGSLLGTLEYATDLFRAETIERFARQLATLLDAALAVPSTPVSALPLLGNEERAEVLALSAGLPADGRAGPNVAAAFTAHAAARPHSAAVELQGHAFTYAQIDRLSNRAARLLRARGVGTETPVVLLMERALETIVAWVAVLKAGGFVVPVDPAYPAERVAFMLQDSGARIVLTQERWMDRVPAGADGVALDAPGTLAGFSPAPVETAIEPESLAYVVYTSGSTGRPKAASMTHANLAAYIGAVGMSDEMTAADRVLHRSPASFDAAVHEIWIALALGGTLVVAPPGAHADPAALAREAAERRVTVIEVVPSILAAMLDAPEFARCADLRLLRCGGEALPAPVAARAMELLPRARFVNAYGPSETTVVACTQTLAPGDPITIGAPLPGARTYVLDTRGTPSPLGVPGELHIGGAVVGRGYRGRPALTAERFIPDPFAATPGARMYRTGDRVRWIEGAEARECRSALGDGEASVESGHPARMPSRESAKAGFGPLLPRIHSPVRPTLEFLGRVDFQLKLRGQRIEPGEVESVLVSEPSVKAAVVAARPGPGGDPHLVAWVVPAEGGEVSVEALRAAMARRLPRHMVPSAIVPVEALPLGPGGKVDRAALPDPAAAAAGRYVEPYTPEEIEMADLWSEVLGVPRVGANDDFFMLGGHSLLAVRLMARIRERFGRELPLAELFRAPTLAELAAAVARAGEGAPAPTLVTLHAGGTRTPVFFVHPAGGTVFRYADLARALGPDQPFHGLQARGVSDDLPPSDRIDEMVERYAAAIREAFPNGPYLIGGWSAGGPVAFALAARLREMGEDAPLAIILDAVAPGHGDDPPPFDDVDLYLRFAYDLLGTDEAAAAELEAGLRAVPAEEREAAMSRWLARGSAPAPPGMVTQIGRTVRLWAAMDRALKGWRPPRYDGDVLLVESELGSPGGTTPPGGLVAGWAPYVGGKLEYHVVPGAHATMVLEPWVAPVARAVREALARVAPTDSPTGASTTGE
ncbi:MAG TPA: amino acid adenylation domain-containing protein [Longimicrobium sp.]|nr:amino acid adenylation domain-containing protein [Longimicrobium sp.]